MSVQIIQITPTVVAVMQHVCKCVSIGMSWNRSVNKLKLSLFFTRIYLYMYVYLYLEAQDTSCIDIFLSVLIL